VKQIRGSLVITGKVIIQISRGWTI